MKGSSWKKLQRLVYGFYALVYVHVLLMMMPGARQGKGGYLLTVNVTIEKDQITDISMVFALDDEPYWSEGMDIISRILSVQSTNVDTVSGATFGSSGIRDAVKAALSSAKN